MESLTVPKMSLLFFCPQDTSIFRKKLDYEKTVSFLQEPISLLLISRFSHINFSFFKHINFSLFQQFITK